MCSASSSFLISVHINRDVHMPKPTARQLLQLSKSTSSVPGHFASSHAAPSQNHRITEWLSLIGTSGDHLVQPSAQAESSRAHCAGPCPGTFWISREGDSTTSLGNLSLKLSHIPSGTQSPASMKDKSFGLCSFLIVCCYFCLESYGGIQAYSDSIFLTAVVGMWG